MLAHNNRTMYHKYEESQLPQSTWSRDHQLQMGPLVSSPPPSLILLFDFTSGLYPVQGLEWTDLLIDNYLNLFVSSGYIYIYMHFLFGTEWPYLNFSSELSQSSSFFSWTSLPARLDVSSVFVLSVLVLSPSIPEDTWF